jgi:hypothetical protein
VCVNNGASVCVQDTVVRFFFIQVHLTMTTSEIVPSLKATLDLSCSVHFRKRASLCVLEHMRTLLVGYTLTHVNVQSTEFSVLLPSQAQLH